MLLLCNILGQGDLKKKNWKPLSSAEGRKFSFHCKLLIVLWPRVLHLKFDPKDFGDDLTDTKINMYQYAGLFYWPSYYWLLTRIIHAQKNFVTESSNSQKPVLHCCSNMLLNWLTGHCLEWCLFLYIYSLVSLWELKRRFFDILDSSYSSVFLILSFWKCFLESKSFIYFDQLID